MEALYISTSKPMNRKALIGIYDQYSTPLFRYAFRLLGDQQLAEDCVSETFSRLIDAVRGGGGPTDNVKAYLYRIAHNWVTDHYRNQHREPTPIDLEHQAGQEHDSPSQTQLLNHQREQLRLALVQLPSDQRIVIELRFIEEWSHREIARVLGKSPEAIRSMQYRALAKLRSLLLDEVEAAESNGSRTI